MDIGGREMANWLFVFVSSTSSILYERIYHTFILISVLESYTLELCTSQEWGRSAKHAWPIDRVMISSIPLPLSLSTPRRGSLYPQRPPRRPPENFFFHSSK